MRQQIRAIRRVSRKYSCSFSNIDWGFRLSQGDIASSFDEDDRPVLQHPSTTMDEEVEENVKEGQRSTIVSEGSTATMDTAASRIRVSHRTLVTALNSWKGSLRGMFVHVDESHHSSDGSDEEECSVDATSVTACTLTCLNDEKQPDCYCGEMEEQQLHDEVEQQPAQQQQQQEQETQLINSDEALLEQWAESVTTFHKSTTSSTTAPVSHASSNIDDSERSTTLLEDDMFLHWDGSLARCQRTSIISNNTTDKDVISISPTTRNAISRVESSGSFAVDAEGFLHWDATSRR